MIRKTTQASEDLIEIWIYIAKDNQDAADRLLDRFEEQFQMIFNNPQIGPEKDYIARGLRYFPIDNYIILYRIVENEIEIVRVLRGARKIEDLF